MAEIGGPRHSTSIIQPSLANAPHASVALTLSRSLDGLVKAGEQLSAQVLASRPDAKAHLLTLQTKLASGRELTLQATSPRAFASGHTLVLQVQGGTQVAATAIPQPTPITQLDLKQLPPGTQLQLKVLTHQATSNGQGFTLTALVQNGPLAGQRLSLETTLKLVAGTLMTASIKSAQEISLTPAIQRLEQAALLTQLNTHAAKQGSLESLFKSLQGLNSQPLPEGLKNTIGSLLGSIVQTSSPSAKTIANAFANSGAFMETRLLAGLSVEHDIKAQLLRVINQLHTALPTAAPLVLTQAMPALLREALERIQPKTANATFPLASRVLQNLDQEPDLQLLLRLAAAAVSRIHTHQLSALSQTQTDPNGNIVTTWQGEVPLQNGQHLSFAQLKFQSEQQKNTDSHNPAQALWRIDLAFDLEPLGPLQVRAQLHDGHLSGTLWAEREITKALVEREISYLQTRLKEQGVEVGEFNCEVGRPTSEPRTDISHVWVSEKV